MKLLNNITDAIQNTDREVQPQPNVIITTKFSNPRITNINLDTSGEQSTIDGTFAIDITNTGFLPTRATRVTNASITFRKNDTSLNIGRIEEPVSMPSIPPGTTKTISIGFERQSQFINTVVSDVCEEQVITADISLTVSEILLAATYEETVEVNIQQKECKTIQLDISGQQQVNVDQQYEWVVSTTDGSNLPEVQWNMGDGTSKTGSRVSHEYSTEGTYEVRAETPSGISNSIEVTAQTVPLGIVGNTDVTVDDQFAWRATGTQVSDLGELTWNMGDGTSYTGQNVSHTYSSSGTFTINLTSEVGESASLEVTSEFPDISISINGNTDVIVGESNQWAVSGSNISAADEIQWSMGDATRKTGTEISHSYNEGEYEIRAAAIISDTEVASDTITVNSSFTDISIDISGGDNREVQSNQQVTFAATGNNVGDATKIEWDMGDASGTILEGTEVTHTYDTSGEYQVEVDAIIDGNVISTDTQTVTAVLMNF